MTHITPRKPGIPVLGCLGHRIHNRDTKAVTLPETLNLKTSKHMKYKVEVNTRSVHEIEAPSKEVAEQLVSGFSYCDVLDDADWRYSVERGDDPRPFNVKKGVTLCREALESFEAELNRMEKSNYNKVCLNSLADCHDQLSRGLHWFASERDAEYVMGGRATQLSEYENGWREPVNVMEHEADND